MPGLRLGGGLGGDLAFLGLAFFLLNILFFHSAMPRNAVFPESGHNFRAKRSLAFLGRSLSLFGSAFCARKNGIRQKHDNANSFLGRSLVGFADLKPDVGWSIFLHRCKAIQLLEFLLKKSGVCMSQECACHTNCTSPSTTQATKLCEWVVSKPIFKPEFWGT